MNPYSGAGFVEFFAILFQRILTGGKIATDEVQLAVLACCAVACGILGPFLVLKRMTCFANSLSHTSLVGIVLAFFIVDSLLLGAVFSALLTAVLSAGLVRVFRLQEEASIGLVFTSLFAVGVILVSLYTRNSHLSTEAVMGNCDALQLSDLRFAAGTLLLNLIVVILFYRKLQLAAFDESYSRTLGLKIHVWRSLLYLLTAITCVGSFRAVGALVVLSLLVGPFLTARLFCQNLSRLLIWTSLLGALASAIAVALSRAVLSSGHVALSTGGILSVVVAAMYVVSWCCCYFLRLNAKEFSK